MCEHPRVLCILTSDLTLGSTSRTLLGLGVQAWSAHLPLPPIHLLHTLQSPISTFQGSAAAFPFLCPVGPPSSAKAQSFLCDPVQPPLTLGQLLSPPWAHFRVTLGIDYRPLSLCVPKSVSPPLKYGSAWGKSTSGLPGVPRPPGPAYVVFRGKSVGWPCKCKCQRSEAGHTVILGQAHTG